MRSELLYERPVFTQDQRFSGMGNPFLLNKEVTKHFGFVSVIHLSPKSNNGFVED